MAVDGHLNFDTKINTSGFNKGLKSISNLVGGAGKAVSGLGKVFTPVTAAVAGVGTAAAGTTINFTKLYESSMVVFEKMLGGKQAASDLYDSLLSIAKASTFSQEAFLSAGKTLVGMGTDAAHTTAYMQAITDAVAGFGGTSQNLQDVATNFAKISTAGRLSMEDVNILSDNGIQALKILGNQYGKTTEEMREMISDGSVPAQEALDKLTEGIENGTDGVNGYTAAMKGMSLAMKGKTLTGALDSLNSGFRGFALNLTGINPTLKETDEGYAESTKRLQQLTAIISTVAGMLPGVANVFSGVTDAIGKLLDKIVGSNVAFDEATGTWQNVEGVLGGLKDKLENMDPEKLKEIGNAIASMAAAGAVLPVVGKGITKVSDALGIAATISGKASDSIKMVPNAFKTLSKNAVGVKKSMGDLGTAIALPFTGLGAKIKGSLSEFMKASAEMWNTGAGGAIVRGAQNVVAKVSGAFKTLASSTIGAYGSLLGSTLNGVLKSVAAFAPAFIKLLGFGTILGAVIAGLGLVQGQFGDQIDGILHLVTTQGPEIITKLCNGITSKLPELMAQGTQLLVNFMTAITANIPAVVSGGISIIAGLVSGVASALPQLIPAAVLMIATLVTSLISNIPQLISAGLQLLTGLAQGIVNAIPIIIAAIPTIIQGLVSGISQNLPQIIVTGIQIIAALLAGIVGAIPQLLAAIPKIFVAFAKGITSVDWVSVGKSILNAIVDGVKSIGSSLVDGIKSVFTGGEEAAEESGKKTGDNYASGLDSASENVSMSALNLGNSATTGLDNAGTAAAFTASAQNAADGFNNTLNSGSLMANLAGASVGNAANSGVQSTDMPTAFSTTGAESAQSMASAISGQTGNVSAAASGVATSAQNSVGSVNLGNTYATVGTQAMQGLATSITAGSSNVSTAAQTAAKAAVTGMKNANLSARAKTEGKNMVSGLTNAIRSGTGTVRSAVSALMNAAKNAANGLGSHGYTIGLQFSAGLARGITAGQNGVASAAAQVAKAAAEAAKKNLDVRSPSRVATWIGKMFDTGLAKGLIKNTDKVITGSMQMTRTLADETQKALESLQKRALYSMTADGLNLHEQSTSPKNTPKSSGNADWIDEWERRQRRLNNERDSRPVILDSRRIDRAMRGGTVLV